MKKVIFFVGLVVCAFYVTGCATATHFEKLPSKQEFSKPLGELRTQYRDLTRFSGASRDWFGSIFDMPEAESMIQAWDPPQRTAISWWSLPGLFIHPTTCWYWTFGDKEVKARIDHPIAFGWRPHVWKLRVEEKKK
jgi:hypothetical protein